MSVSFALFEDHLESINQEQWQKLWDIIPLIEHTQQFGTWEGMSCIGSGIQMPYFIAGPVIDEFIKIIDDLDLMVEYDWMNWTTGRYAIEHLDFQEEDFDSVDLCCLITMILRSNRFREGLTGACFEKGLVLKILYALKNKVEQ